MPGHDASDDAPNRPPRDPQELGDGRPAALLSKVGRPLLEGVREAAARSRPGHLLGLHGPTRFAVDPSDRVLEVNHHPGEVEMPPAPDTPVLDPASLAPALSAPEASLPRTDFHDQTRGVEVETTNDQVLDGKDDSEYCRSAHDGVPGEGR